VNGIPENFKILHVLEFTSDRRRMGILLRKEESEDSSGPGPALLFMKGSDDSIFRRSGDFGDKDADFGDQVESFSRLGLRTLVVAFREV
jgi:magnesium-transporting ATPase (P-type)